MRLLVDDDRDDLGRLQRRDHELSGVRRPHDDVDLLAADLVSHRGDARATQAHAGTDRVDALIVGLDRDLGAQAGVAGAGLELEQPVLDLGDLELEELHEELGRGARQHELRAAGAAVDAQQEGLDAVAHAQVLARDLLVARQHGLHAADLDDRVAALHALDRAGDEEFLAVEEVVEHLLALGVADPLQDDLLGGLGADAAEVDRLELFLDVVADLHVGAQLAGVDDAHLGLVVHDLLVEHYQPAALRGVITRIAVDRHHHVGIVVDAFLGRRGQGGFERGKNDLLGDVLLTRQGIDKQQDLAAHFSKTSTSTVSKLGHQACFLDVVEGQQHFALLGAQRHRAVLHPLDHTHEIALIADRQRKADLRLLAGKAFEVGQLLERAIEAGRGHLEPVVVDVLDLEHALQLVAYGGAIVDRDAALDVEEDAQQAALGRELDIHEFVSQSGHHLLDQSLDVRSHLPAPPLRRHIGHHK